MSSTELMHKAMELSRRQRASLAKQLILSLEPKMIDADSDQAWEVEIERRLKALDHGKTKLVDWRDSVKRVRKSLRRNNGR